MLRDGSLHGTIRYVQSDVGGSTTLKYTIVFVIEHPWAEYLVGANLSEPHTSRTALRKCVNRRPCGHILN